MHICHGAGSFLEKLMYLFREKEKKQNNDKKALDKWLREGEIFRDIEVDENVLSEI